MESKWLNPSPVRQRQSLCRYDTLNAVGSLRHHWPEYVMEAAGLALYMFFVCVFATLLQHPASPARDIIVSPVLRRALMGLAVGATLVAIIMTPWGKQSGGHFNPAITFTFYRLGKVRLWDALFYAAGQFSGATSGVATAAYLLRGARQKRCCAVCGDSAGRIRERRCICCPELTISFTLMGIILFASNHRSLAQFTPYFVGALYATYITLETPLSGMSMNPARTFGSALYASYWHALWIYFAAPALGMLAAAELFLRTRGGVAPYCAKLYHTDDKRCIFHHGNEIPL